ncbi:MAG: cadmium-translocating P-type ATPase [Firmicutes bacterium HGW-Firmicutes-20]|nr:MAG: cadmium-translocating P-type ATPase [Firmicutes bacterium HGW-Firmicutes-20]
MRGSDMKEITILLDGLTCANCGNKIEKSINNRPDVELAKLDFLTNRLTIKFNKENQGTDIEHIKTQILAIEDVNIIVEEETIVDIKKQYSLDQIRLVIGIFGLLISLLSDGLIFKGIALGIYVFIGYPVFKKAFLKLRRKDMFDENFLMSIATIGAIAINEIPEALGVMVFYTVGEYFQDKAVNRSKNAISKLLDVSVNQAVVVIEGKHIIKNPHQVLPGEVVFVAKGAKVPCDGTIIKGESMFDNKSITGESMPVQKTVDEDVIAGAVNLGNPVFVIVKKPYEDSSLARLVRYMQQASLKKARAESYMSKFAAVYTPTVVAIAFVVFIVSSFYLSDAREGLYRGLIFLVISCPCAMVISVPLGYFAAMGYGGTQGILFKGGEALESALDIETVLFDKTGTLTKGNIVCVHKVTIDDHDISKSDEIVNILEKHSGHPIAKALVLATESNSDLQITNIVETAGVGISGEADGKRVEIVSFNEVALSESLLSVSRQYPMAVVLKIDSHPTAIYFLDDEIKPDSAETIHRLKQWGIKTIMVSGDREASAQRIAQQLGIDEIFSQLLPHEKLAVGERLKTEKRKFAFVGDGVNDAAIITLSDCGMAMGGLGSDLTIEAADIVLLKDRPMDVVKAIEIAKKTRKIMITNLAFIFAVKIIILALGSLGYASMWAAVFADVGVALLAVLNAVRILHHET